MAEKILIVDSDERIRSFLADNFTADRFKVLEADSVSKALALIKIKSCHIVVTELALEGESGFEICDYVRGVDGLANKVDPGLPLIAMGTNDSDTHRVRVFERGFDDFVPKPFHYPELLARVRALLRRSSGRRRMGLIYIGDLVIDPSTRTVSRGTMKIGLSAKEYALLLKLASDPTKVWTKKELLEAVWGFSGASKTRTLDSHCSRLRRKLGGAHSRYVLNTWGVGFRLVDEVS